MAANADTVLNAMTLNDQRAPVDSNGIAELAKSAADLNLMIRNSATHPTHRKTLRKFLLGLKVETFYRRLDRHPELPQGATPNPRRREFTLEEAFVIREAFKLPPKRAPDQPGLIVSICNFKGGVAKTTTAAHLAQYLVMHGYRVLLVDLDAQASLTQLFGILPHTEVGDQETVRTFLEGPSFGGVPNPDWTGDLRSVVQTTHWPNLDLIPSNLGVYGSEFAIAARLRDEEGFAFHRPLADGLAPLRKDYDVILLDTAPSLSFVNSNAMFAADGLLITLPPAMIDLQSSSLFFELVAELMDAFNRSEPTPKTYDFVSVLLTRVRPNDATHSQITKWIRHSFPEETCAHSMVQSSALEKVGPELLTLYEVSDYDGDRRTLERAIDAMNNVNGEVELLIRRALDAAAGVAPTRSPSASSGSVESSADASSESTSGSSADFPAALDAGVEA
jgi:chromosome partitioning protein